MSFDTEKNQQLSSFLMRAAMAAMRSADEAIRREPIALHC
jgi:hypothetical protein